MRLVLAALVSLTAHVALANVALAQDAVPTIAYESVPNLLKLPDDMHLGEVAGVAVNLKGHIFVYSRGGSSAGPAYGNTASQLLEFNPNGKFVREIGKNLYAWALCAHRAHRQGRQHLGHRQGLGHDHQVQPAGPRRDGVRAQVRGLRRRSQAPRAQSREAAAASRTAASASRPT